MNQTCKKNPSYIHRLIALKNEKAKKMLPLNFLLRFENLCRPTKFAPINLDLAIFRQNESGIPILRTFPSKQKLNDVILRGR